MVAVAENLPTAEPAKAEPVEAELAEALVTLAAGDEASGLARITAQYLEQLLADSPEKRAEAARLRGRLGLHAREGNVEVTLVFGDGAIAVEEGLHAPDAVISGSVETLLNLLAGRENPALALGRRAMSLRISGRNPLFGYRAYRLMRLPGVHVWSGVPPRVVVAVGVIGAATLLLLLYWRSYARREVGGS